MADYFDSVTDKRLIQLLKTGAVGVLPSDTVYGIVGLARLPAAVRRIHTAKRRRGKLGTIIAASVEQLIDLGLDPKALREVQHLWPNPVSVIIPAGPDLQYLHLDIGSVAVRIPKSARLRRLLGQTGPLATTSANITDQPTAITLAEAQEIFGETVDFYVEGGELSGRPPSTIIRLDDGKVEVLRAGAVTIDESGQIVEE